MKIESTDFSKKIKKVTWYLEDVSIHAYLVIQDTTFYSFVEIVDKSTCELITRKHVHPKGMNFNIHTISDFSYAAKLMKKQVTEEFTPITKLRVPYGKHIKDRIVRAFVKVINCVVYRTCNYIPSPISNKIIVN